MRINFFEEFYNEESLLERISSLSFPSTIYIANRSLDGFLHIKHTVEKKFHNIEVAFWPILPTSYWISPFCSPKELHALYKSLEGYKGKKRIKVLLDLELPLLSPMFFIIHAKDFKRNKKMIQNILLLSSIRNIDFFAAEFPAPNIFLQSIAGFLGIHYSQNKYKHTTIFMQYTSILGVIGKLLMKPLIEYVKKHKDTTQIALGTLCTGVLGYEKKILPDTLRNELSDIKNHRIPIVNLYSLKGFTQSYRQVIAEFISSH